MVALLLDLVRDLLAPELTLGWDMSAVGIPSSKDSAETPFLMLAMLWLLWRND